MAEIIPAILPKTFQELEEKLSLVKGLCQFVHIDICDGKFGQTRTWPLVSNDENFQSILRQEHGLPFWEDFDFEVHLMTEDPLSHSKDWIDAGASRLIFHVETLNYENDIQHLDQLKTEGYVEIGIAINAGTSVEELKPYFQVADFIQVMTIANIGAQGEGFDARGIDHIQWIKQNYKEMVVSVDGAMSGDTAEIALQAGADRIVVGSYIISAVNPREAIEELKSLG